MERHSVFNLQSWMSEEEILKTEVDGFSSLISPVHAIQYEKLLRASIPSGAEKVPVDIFIFGQGRPSARPLTKIGGAPFRPKKLAWPLRAGIALDFIGQLCFIDSFDIVSKEDCYGEVLLVFKDPTCSFYYLEWQSAKVQEEICSKVEARGTVFEEYFGQRWRTIDLIHGTDNFNLISQGIKIGGVVPSNEHGYTGHLLGSITSFEPAFDCEFPFVNVKKPLNLSEWDKNRTLLIDPLEMWACCFRKSATEQLEQINFERIPIYNTDSWRRQH